MSTLGTSFLGIALRNPVIVSASSLTATAGGVKKAANNGAGAVVLKSLFEEQIQSGIDALDLSLDTYAHPEAREYLKSMGKRAGPEDYVELIRQAKSETDIPIIASLNCVEGIWWSEFANRIELAGADGLELNIGLQPASDRETSADIEQRVYEIIDRVGSATRLPLAVKLGPYFSNLGSLAQQIIARKVKALVLFNRYYQLDINLDSMALKAGMVFSNPQDYYPSLRWLSLLYGNVPYDLSAATGIHDWQTAAKMLLVGASTVQLCSTIYRNGYSVIRTILDGLENWMISKGFHTLDEVRGLLSQKKSAHPKQYERLQYIKALTGLY